MTPGTLGAIKHKTRPSEADRRKMIRVLIDALREFDPNPRRGVMNKVAQMVVKQYPESFEDRTSAGQKIGNGYDQLTVQLKNRLEHSKRASLYYQKEQAMEGKDINYGFDAGQVDGGPSMDYKAIKHEVTSDFSGNSMQHVLSEHAFMKANMLYNDQNLPSLPLSNSSKTLHTTHILTSSPKIKEEFTYSSNTNQVSRSPKLEENFLVKEEKREDLYDRNKNDEDDIIVISGLDGEVKKDDTNYTKMDNDNTQDSYAPIAVVAVGDVPVTVVTVADSQDDQEIPTKSVGLEEENHFRQGLPDHFESHETAFRLISLDEEMENNSRASCISRRGVNLKTASRLVSLKDNSFHYRLQSREEYIVHETGSRLIPLENLKANESIFMISGEKNENQQHAPSRLVPFGTEK